MLTLKKKLALCWRILRAERGNSISHAERELAEMRATGEEMDAMMADCLEEMVLVFSTQGHSGFSASYARQVLDRLLDFKPVGPLTGTEEEWTYLDYGCDDMVAQNKRCGHVFLRADGTAYDSSARVFREPSGACFTSGNSRVDITFPYTPSVEYVDVAEER